MNWSDFRKAIEDSEEPTLAYLYRTLAEQTRADHRASAQLAGALFERLQPPLVSGGPTSTTISVRVVYKVLHLVRVLCEQGHPDFQREAQRLSQGGEVLRLHSRGGGGEDPVHGDALNRRVRAEAKAALDATFGDRAYSERAGSITGGGGDGAMEGFGNPEFSAGKHSGGQDSFRTGGRHGGSGGGGEYSGTTNSSGGGFSALAPSGRIGEMLAENRWMAHAAEQETRRGTATAATAPSGNTLLAQLTETAKGGWDLIRQHEAMRSKEDRIYEGSGARAAGQAAHYDKEAEGGAASAYLPVGVPRSHEEDGTGTNTYSQQQQQQPASATAASRFSFLNAAAQPPSAPALTTREPSAAAVPLEEERPLRRLVLRLATAKSAPQRVELAAFVAACLTEGERLAAAQEAGQRQQRTVFSFLDGASTDTATTADSSSPGASVWALLPAALEEQLAAQLPWQQRLNALCCLEALLTRCGGSSGGGTTSVHEQQEQAPALACGAALRSHFARRPEAVRRNAQVAQASLADKADRVAAILQLPQIPPQQQQQQQRTAVVELSTVATTGGGLSLDGLTLRTSGGGGRRGNQPGSSSSPSPSRTTSDLFGSAPSSTLSLDHQQQQQHQQPTQSLFGCGSGVDDDGSATRPRRRGPNPGATATAASVPAVAAASQGQPSYMDNLFEGPTAVRPTANTDSSSTSHIHHQQPSIVESLLVPQQQSSRPAITVLGVHANSNSTSTAMGPFSAMGRKQQPDGSVSHGSPYSDGYPPAPAVVVVDGGVVSSHFSMGGVPSAGPPAGSVQGMNRAFAEMQRKLMADGKLGEGEKE